MNNLYTELPWYQINKNFREGISTKIVYIQEPKTVQKDIDKMVYIIPTIIMIVLIIIMLCKEYKRV